MSPSIEISPGLQRIYESISLQMGASERFIGNAESVPLEQLFPRPMNTWSNHRVLNVVQAPTKTGEAGKEKEFLGFVVCKLGGYEDGQRLGAAGGCQPDATINDQSHVKGTLVGLPIEPGHEAMDDLAHDQSVAFGDITVCLSDGQRRYDAYRCDPNVVTRLLTMESPSCYEHEGATIGPFKVVTEDMYTVISKKANKIQPSAPATRTKRKRADGDGNEPSSSTTVPPPPPIQATPPSSTTTASENITLNSKYPVSSLADHVGPRFQHVNAEVVQFNIRDINNKLVAPARYRVELRKGTIALICVGWRKWHMPATASFSKESLTFQMVMRSLKVLKESDLPDDSIDLATPETPTPPVASTSEIPTDVADDLAAFTLPSMTTVNDTDVAMTTVTEGEPPTAGSSVAKGKKKRTT